MKDLAARHRALAWVRAEVAVLRAGLEPALARGAAPPPADPPSGWGHRYVCGACQTRLAFDPASPHRHRCPACGWQGEGRAELDEAWAGSMHLQLVRWAEQAAAVGWAAGDRACLDYARAVLLGYAGAYAGYAEHGERAGTGRIGAQSLDEAVWMLPAARACDLLERAGALPAADAARIAEGLFRPGMALLRRQTGAVHNIHLWMAAALWALAERCASGDDRACAERVIAANLARGVLAHGSWYEISPVYHYYSCEALLGYARAAHAAGRACLADAALPAMLRAQLPLVLPDGELAPANDGWPSNPLAAKAPFYEVAEGLWGGFAGVLGHCYGALGARRGGLEALLYGPDEVPAGALAQPALAVVDGIAVARRGGITAWIKATPDAGGHDHADKPALNLWLAGGLRAGDIGNPGYGSPFHAGWFARTWAHNCLLVDGAEAERGGAAIDRTVDLPGLSVVTALSDGAHPGVSVRRLVALGEGWVVDWLRAEGAAAHRWQSLFHAAGALDGGGQPWAVLGSPHATAQRLLARAAWCGSWHGAAGRLQVEARPPADGLVAAFTGPDLPTDRTRDCLVVEGGGTVFSACLLLWPGDGPCPVQVVDADGGLLLAACGGRWRISAGGAVRRA